MNPPRIPTDCPRCGKVLYPISAMRPKARLSWLAILGYVIAGSVSAAIYWIACLHIDEATQGWMPSKVIGFIVLVPALLPGLLLALPVSRLPGVIKLHCARCHWSESLPVYRTTSPLRWLRRSTGQAMAGLGSARVMPAPTVEQPVALPTDARPQAASVFDQIVDERQKHHEIKAWIYAEFVSGRSFEEIFGEMISGGWSKDDAEALVEEGRKATRDRRP